MVQSPCGLGEIKITFEDLIAAFVGSLLFIVLWWLVSWYIGKNRSQ